MEVSRLVAYGLIMVFGLLLAGPLLRTHNSFGRMLGVLALACAVNGVTFFSMLLASEIFGRTPAFSCYLFLANAWLMALSLGGLWIRFVVRQNGNHDRSSHS